MCIDTVARDVPVLLGCSAGPSRPSPSRLPFRYFPDVDRIVALLPRAKSRRLAMAPLDQVFNEVSLAPYCLFPDLHPLPKLVRTIIAESSLRQNLTCQILNLTMCIC